jgi:hypothetical protein
MATGVRTESVGSEVNANLLLSMLVVVLLAAESGAIIASGDNIVAGILGIATAMFFGLVVLVGVEKEKARQ